MQPKTQTEPVQGEQPQQQQQASALVFSEAAEPKREARELLEAQQNGFTDWASF